MAKAEVIYVIAIKKYKNELSQCYLPPSLPPSVLDVSLEANCLCLCCAHIKKITFNK